MASGSPNITNGLHMMAKPAGPSCNLACEYCFYLEKHALFPGNGEIRMPDEVLEAYIRKYILSQPASSVEFVWQGGEPTLLGVDFFRKVVELQKPHKSLRTITNSLQTNGTLLTDEWCAFLKENGFLVGLSLDGPREVHDRYRVDRSGNGTFDRVMKGLRLLQRHGVEYNVMACVARDTAYKFLSVYGFFRNEGIKFIQFTPVVERLAGASSRGAGFDLAGPADLRNGEKDARVAPWSVDPAGYGVFLSGVFDEWVRKDVGEIFVMNFEWALNSWIGNPSPTCVNARRCGGCLALEHNGDVYACDHAVYPEYRLGNILTGDPAEMANRSRSSGFGKDKETALPSSCRSCEVLSLCRGGCPKHRFMTAYNGEPGLHYLCPGYKKFFLHIRKYLSVMTQLLEHGLPVPHIMKAMKGPLVIKLDP